jgi:hypothetical protein
VAEIILPRVNTRSASCKFELHGPALRHVLEVPLFVSGDALRLSMSARDGRSIVKVRADRTSKTSAQKWHRSSFLLQHAECKLVSSNCTDWRCVMYWRCPSSFMRMHSGAACQRAAAAALSRCVPTERRNRARKSGRDHPSSRQHAECKLQVRTARTGAASCVGGVPLRFRGFTPAQHVSA